VGVEIFFISSFRSLLPPLRLSQGGRGKVRAVFVISAFPDDRRDSCRRQTTESMIDGAAQSWRIFHGY
jgi:hypothetical protein